MAIMQRISFALTAVVKDYNVPLHIKSALIPCTAGIDSVNADFVRLKYIRQDNRHVRKACLEAEQAG